MGIEPTSKAWEAAVLPLNYTRAGGGFKRARATAGVDSMRWSPAHRSRQPRDNRVMFEHADARAVGDDLQGDVARGHVLLHLPGVVQRQVPLGRIGITHLRYQLVASASMGTTS